MKNFFDCLDEREGGDCRFFLFVFNSIIDDFLKISNNVIREDVC